MIMILIMIIIILLLLIIIIKLKIIIIIIIIIIFLWTYSPNYAWFDSSDALFEYHPQLCLVHTPPLTIPPSLPVLQ